MCSKISLNIEKLANQIYGCFTHRDWRVMETTMHRTLNFRLQTYHRPYYLLWPSHQLAVATQNGNIGQRFTKLTICYSNDSYSLHQRRAWIVTLYSSGGARMYHHKYTLPWAHANMPPNGISDGSAIFVGLIHVTNRKTKTQTMWTIQHKTHQQCQRCVINKQK